MNETPTFPSDTAIDARRFADYLQGNFPGHTMQRVRSPDGRYHYSYVSPGVMETFGLDPEELTSADGVRHEWIPKSDRDRFVAALERSAATLEIFDEEVRVLRPDGRPCWVRSIGHPKRLPDGTVIWDGVALNVTDRREALEALERAMARARTEEVSSNRLAAIANQDIIHPFEDLAAAMRRLVAERPDDPAVQATRAAFDKFATAFDAARTLTGTGYEPEEEAASTDRHDGISALSARQVEVLQLIKQGKSNRDIGGQLGISEGTVKLHVSAVLKQLGAKNRTMAAALLNKAPSPLGRCR